MFKLMMCVVCLSLVGCLPTTDTNLEIVSPPAVDEGRVKITRIGIFEDSTAYGNRRCIYLIKDTKAGKEYIGISGVGISQTGSHSSGDEHDTPTPDER
jgi:hypothetical protein